ncbi:MAG: type II secretion system F family protein [Rhodospirillales bacterium]|nr:type II secretion system F family protein [Rhodospirillales bacterium]MCB9994991.1 type II secretion system F family protein [Rhodospirillales bacterium]
MNTLSYIILLLIVLVATGMIVAIMISNEKAKKERALAVIKGTKQSHDEDGESSSREAQDKRRAEIAKKLKENEEDEAKGKKKGTSLKDRIRQAGMSISVKQFYIFSFIFSLGFVVLMYLMGLPKLALPFLWFFGFMGLPRMFVKHKIKKRQKQFLEEFGDALEAMVRLLKAGMPVTEAIAMAGREFEGPVGEEMLAIYDSQKVGVPLPEATLEAAERMPITEMQMFATAIAIQTQTGASLSDVLLGLAGVIRARFRLKRKVQALSAEAKASAGIIGSLPFLVGGGMYFINNEYILLLFQTTPGIIMTIAGGTWMMIGVLVMKIMINFKV